MKSLIILAILASIGLVAGAECEDNRDSCADWAARGECEDNPTYMLVNCKLSCDVCDGAECQDNHDSCADWAARGECEDNPKYMLINCELSCGVCEGGEDINECTDGTDNCDVNAACVNTVGSFDCTCNPGYNGDGETCTVAVAESQAIPDDMKAFIVDEHNRLRGTVNPPATNMKTMQWDDDVAAHAAQWAKCENWFTHSGSDYGENIYWLGWSWGSLENYLPYIMGKWWAENQDYDYSSGVCSDDCNHYTQMAWADTSAIGCAYAQNCPGVRGNFWLICNYETRGNWDGQKPYAV